MAELASARLGSAKRRPIDASTRRHWLYFTLMVATAGVFVAYSFPLSAILHQRSATSQAAASLKALRAQDSSLNQQVRHLSTQAGFDQVAREQYQLVHEGQALYLILPPASAPVQSNGGPAPYAGDPGYQPLISPSAGAVTVPTGGVEKVTAPVTTSSGPSLVQRILSSLEFWK